MGKEQSLFYLPVMLCLKLEQELGLPSMWVMTHKYRGSQQSVREVKPKFIDSTQGGPKDIYKP
jgi:hypothetical protein